MARKTKPALWTGSDGIVTQRREDAKFGRSFLGELARVTMYSTQIFARLSRQAFWPNSCDLSGATEDRSTGLIRSKYAATHFCDISKSAGLIDGNLLVHRKIMRGNLANSDTVFAIPGDPLKPSLNLRPWFALTPWLIILSGMGWFFDRRARIKKIRETKPEPFDSGNTT